MTVRRAVLLAACVLAAACLVAAVPPNTPNDGDAKADEMCLLEKLEFSPALHLSAKNGGGGFDSRKFHYTCLCDSNFGGTVVKPWMLDDGSSAEITFNNVPVHRRDAYTAISNYGTALTGGLAKSPNKQSDFLTFVDGPNTIVIGVGCNGAADPDCYYEYTIECFKESSGGLITGDPQFVGLRGQEYQVHGVAGEVYNIVSDADLQYNSRFVFLEEGKCPVVNGKKQKACWSHPGSYLGELGLKTRAGDKMALISGPANEGFQSVTLNGRELEVGETVYLAADLGAISRNSTHLTSINVGNWDFAFENSDLFINQRVRAMDARNLRSHGLLGQTWRDAKYPNAIKYIAGDVDDYVIRSSDLFGDDFVYNAHN